MVSFKKILEEDEHHRAKQLIKGTCDKTVARRLYVRGRYLSVGNLLYSNKKKAVKQLFVPVGVICVTCGYIIANPKAGMSCFGKGKIFKDLMNHVEAESEPESNRPNLHSIPDISRAQRRRREREEKKLKEGRAVIKINEREIFK